MTAVLALLFQVAAAFGGGALLLRLAGVDRELAPAERLAFAFTLGMGAIGWAVFPLGVAGWLAPGPLAAVLAACCLGLPLLGRVPAAAPWSGWERALLAGLAVVAAAGLVAATAPPSDADSTAYHFALPRQFLAAGRLVFTPRAVDGAVPLLLQMTYLPPLALGGELAMTLWTCVSGWAAPALAGAVLARHAGRPWALAAALLVATAPVTVYGAGAGQIEARMAPLLLAAAWAAVRSLRQGSWRWALVAGLAAGFLLGTKYTAPLFVFAIGVVLPWGPRPVVRTLLFGAVAALLGCQWYGWNFVNTGDPVFPVLWGKLPYRDGVGWSDAMAAYFRSTYVAEIPAPRTLGWWLAYPFRATLDSLPIWEGQRAGLGPFAWLALPFALAGAWRCRDRLRASPLLPLAAMLLLAYSLWYFIPSSQRVRHLLPLYPALVVLLVAAAARWRVRPLAAAVALALAFQAAGLGLFELNFVQRLVRGESRDAFLSRMVGGWEAARWANANLGPGDRLFHSVRTINYYLEMPYYYGAHGFQGLVDMAPAAADPRRLLDQLLRLRITHALAGLDSALGHTRLLPELVAAGCAETMARLTVATPVSRTLPGLGRQDEPYAAYRLTPDTPACRSWRGDSTSTR